MFRATEASKGRCLIVGDFNYPTINWQSFESATREDEKFIDLLQDNCSGVTRISSRGWRFPLTVGFQ